MIEINYSQVTSDEFRSALRGLLTQPMPIQSAYNVKKIADKVQQAQRRIGEEYQEKILKPFSKKNEDGSIAWNKNEDGTEDRFQFPIIPEKMAEFEEANKAFGENKWVISRSKLKLSQIANVNLSGQMLFVLSPLLDESSFETEADHASSPEASESAAPTLKSV